MSKKLFYMILGGLIFTGVSVLAYTLASGEVLYETSDNITDSNSNSYVDVQDALDDLYAKQKEYSSVGNLISKISQKIVTSGSGLYRSTTDIGRLIYRGEDPSNWIWLDENGDGNKVDDEMYRIISYESDGTIKVIRNASIGDIAWDKRDGNTNELKVSGPRKNSDNSYCNYNGASSEYYGCNVWGNTSNTYIGNDTILSSRTGNFYYEYYSSSTALDLTHNSNTGTVTMDSSLNTYLNSKTTNSTNSWQPARVLSDIIDTHSFNVGEIYYYNEYSGGDKGLSKEKEEESLLTWNGSIGLMNITEYVEASTNPTCTSVWSNYFYNPLYYYDGTDDNTNNPTQHIKTRDNWPCSNQNYNWMSIGITEWSLSPNSYDRNIVWNVHSAGYFNNYYACRGFGVRPAFYLKSSINLGGTGTLSEPYYIKN